MNYPSRYTGGTKKKIFLRILIVFLSLTAVCTLTLAYGNYLKGKAEKTAGDSSSGAGRPVDAVRETEEDGEERSFSKSVGVKSACIVFDYFDGTEALFAYMDSLAAEGYSGITAVLAGRDGFLTYASESVAEFTRQRPAASKDEGFVSEMISKARSLSMRTSAVIFTSPDFADNSISSEIEALCAADASALGFDEVIAVLPVKAEDINSDVSNDVLSYIGKLAEKCSGTLFGIALDDGIYRTPSLSPQTEMFASGADFLAIDMSDSFTDADQAKSFVTGITGEISGSFTVYGLRVLFDGGIGEIADAQVQALADASFSNYMFSDAPPLPEPDSTETDSTDVTDGANAGDGIGEPATEEPLQTE